MSLCESKFNNSNDTINKYEIKKSINKIVNDLDENVCIDKIIKSKYV